MPTKVERSHWETAEYPPELSIDLDLSTVSKSRSDTTGVNWYRLSFDRVYCIEEIYWISFEPYWMKWNCTKKDCSECHSHDVNDCAEYKGYEITAEVSTTGTPSVSVDSISGCKYGDTILIQHKKKDYTLYVKEFVIKQGESMATIILVNLLIVRSVKGAVDPAV